MKVLNGFYLIVTLDVFLDYVNLGGSVVTKTLYVGSAVRVLTGHGEVHIFSFSLLPGIPIQHILVVVLLEQTISLYWVISLYFRVRCCVKIVFGTGHEKARMLVNEFNAIHACRLCFGIKLRPLFIVFRILYLDRNAGR